MVDADLVWDHSAGERLEGADRCGSQQLDDNSMMDALLSEDDEIAEASGGQHVRLSSNQLRYVLRGLEDAAAVLRERQRSTTCRSRGHRPGSSSSDFPQADVALDGLHASTSSPQPPPPSQLLLLCCRRASPSALQRHVLAITCALQMAMLLSVCVMEVVSTKMNLVSSQLVLAESVLMITIAPLSLLLNICAAGQMVCQLISHEISITLLISSYVGFAISFAGLYTAIFQVKDDSWHVQVPSASPAVTAEVYCRMLYLAISTFCLSSPSVIFPQQWYTYLLLSIQMLVGLLYFGAVVHHLLTAALKQKHLNAGAGYTDSARLHRPAPTGGGRRSRATSQTSLLSRDLHSSNGYGTMPNS